MAAKKFREQHAAHFPDSSRETFFFVRHDHYLSPITSYITRSYNMAVKATTSKKAGSSSTASASSYLEQVQTLQSALLSSSDLNPLSDLLSLAKKLAKTSAERTPKEKKDAAVALHRATLVLTRSMKSLAGDDRIPFDRDVDQDGYILAYGARAANKVDAPGTSAQAKEAKKQVEDWIRMRWNETVELLCGLLGHESRGIEVGSSANAGRVANVCFFVIDTY